KPVWFFISVKKFDLLIETKIDFGFQLELRTVPGKTNLGRVALSFGASVGHNTDESRKQDRSRRALESLKPKNKDAISCRPMGNGKCQPVVISKTQFPPVPNLSGLSCIMNAGCK